MADGAGPTISTHVLDTVRGLPAAGVPVRLFRLDVPNAPIRMTQALTDGDGRIRDLLERPLVAGDYRLEFDIGREDDAFFRRVAVDLRVADATAELPRPAAPGAVLDDDVPGQLSGVGELDVAALDALPPTRVRRGRGTMVRGRAAVPRPAGGRAPVRRRDDALRPRPRRSPWRCPRTSRSS